MNSVVFVIAASAGLFFYLFPESDLRFTELFFDPSGGFLVSYRSSLKALPWLTAILINCLVLMIGANLWRGRWFRQGGSLPSNCKLLFLLLALGLGPGCAVNGVFKSHWGRARPYDLAQFGGTKEFSPPLQPADQCQRNCSFVSGDAAMGYFVLVFAFVSQKRRLLISLTGLFLGSGIGLYRIAQGAHFLSDVIFSALLVYAIAWLLDRLLPLLISEPQAAQSAWLPSVLGMVHTKPN